MTFDEAVSKWTSTPYQHGACEPGRGVDCVRFMDKVLQDWRGVWLEPLPNEAMGSALHNARVFVKIRDLVVERHRAKVCIPPYHCGDVLALSMLGNPFHVAVVGTDNVSAWHACEVGVVKTSVQALSVGTTRIREAWRPSCT